jgi:LPXTG-motif cell wall-anchored protein
LATDGGSVETPRDGAIIGGAADTGLDMGDGDGNDGCSCTLGGRARTGSRSTGLALLGTLVAGALLLRRRRRRCD